MVYWNRFISYIYRYHDGHKCENSGFAKVAKVGRTGRLTVGLRNGMNSREEIYGVFIYRETLADEGAVGGEQTNEPVMIPLPVLVGKMRLRNGHGEECFSFCWDDVMESGRPVTAFAGIVIRRIQPDGNMGQEYYDSDIFCSSWTDSVIDYSRMWDAKRAGRDAEELSEAVREASITDTVTAELELESCATPAEPVCSDEVETSETGTAIDKMFENYERLPLLPGSSLDDGLDSVIESVKISPNDIGLLDMCNWKLGVNSFLTHGYYSYKYLMFGKVIFSPDDDRVSYILGVPGVYSSREKYLAGIFGFDRFVPEKETHIKTGSFGYWIVDIR